MKTLEASRSAIGATNAVMGRPLAGILRHLGPRLRGGIRFSNRVRTLSLWTTRKAGWLGRKG